METKPAICDTCSNKLPDKGYFCGGCLTQFKCKSCEAILEKEHMGCIMCGTPKEVRGESKPSSNMNSNSFKLHETTTDRTIEATFSDNVGKDLAGILRDAYSIKLAGGIENFKQISDSNNNDVPIKEAEILNNDTSESNSITNEINSNQYPTLIAIAMKNLPTVETEWVVVYSFYASNFGKSIFTRQNIIEKYVISNRKNPDRLGALSSYIKQAVRAGYLNPLESGYSIMDEGVRKAKEILSRTGGAPSKLAKGSSKGKTESINEKGRKISSGSIKTLKRLSNIDFSPSGKESLNSFYKKFTIKSDFERNLIFVYYMEEVLKLNSISYDHIYTCYDDLNLRVPENLPQTIRNTKSKTGWIETIDSSKISVTVKGRNKIKFWDKKD